MSSSHLSQYLPRAKEAELKCFGSEQNWMYTRYLYKMVTGEPMQSYFSAITLDFSARGPCPQLPVLVIKFYQQE